MLTYPHINPIAISIGPIFGFGPLRVHWYGIMYLIGFVAAWWLARYRARQPGSTWGVLDIDDLIFYCAIGVIVGGRVGWCVFYGHDVIAENWLNVFHIWDGGMSFHGGMTGVGLAAVVFARVKHKRISDVLDFLAPLPGIGLLAGRLGNFINGELWGRPASVPWAMVFPQVDAVPRHPSQLYELGLEGIVLFVLLWLYARRRRPVGAVSGLFLIGYGSFRFLVEYAREPDNFLGALALGWTMGQWLSLPMIVVGVGLMVWAYWRAGKAQPTLFGS